MSLRCVVSSVLLAVLTSCALAQRAVQPAAPSRPSVPHFNLPSGNLAFARNANSSSRFRHSSPLGGFFSPFFDNFYDPNDTSAADGSGASQPPAFLMQAANALSGPSGYAGMPGNNREPSPSQPLIIELQGDRYVRVSNTPIDGEALPLKLAPDKGHLKSAQSTSAHSQFGEPVASDRAMPGAAIASMSGTRDLPPVVLFFRDGHSEEVYDYTIVDGCLYARGDYYVDGYWNKKIDLAAVDLQQTLQANSARNVKFVLPSAPNEVITRP